MGSWYCLSRVKSFSLNSLICMFKIDFHSHTHTHSQTQMCYLSAALPLLRVCHRVDRNGSYYYVMNKSSSEKMVNGSMLMACVHCANKSKYSKMGYSFLHIIINELWRSHKENSLFTWMFVYICKQWIFLMRLP